jgi:NAD-dependent protein deacetylase/lipoamidase
MQGPLTDQVVRAADLIRQARHAVAMTGAGISTASGIPDFRSPGSGLWTKADPREVASIDGFMRNPRAYYEWRRPLLQTLLHAEPNPAHCALAELERSGPLRAIITQNIDGLHQRAGSQRVLEVHGRARELVCLGCGRLDADDTRMAQVIDSGDVPHCARCGGLLKPNVVFFGELLPSDVLAEVEHEVRHCDLVIVAGTSLEVQPACLWPEDAMRHGAKAIVVNFQSTYLDHRAEVVIHEDVAAVLPAIVAAMAG